MNDLFVNTTVKKNRVFEFSPHIWLMTILLIYALFFFLKVTQKDWIFTGDTLNSFGQYCYNYFGYARGEYPLWNPLVRGGQPSLLFNVFLTANPVINLVAIFSVLSGVEDVILSFSISIFLLLLFYVIGVYLLVSCWLDNKYAGVLAAILALGSSSVFYQFYHNSFLLLLHHIPWILYAVTMYFRTFKFRYLIIFSLAFNSALYSYMFAIPLIFLIMVLISFAFVYHKQFFDALRSIKKIPIWHIFALGSILLVMLLPVVLMFMEFRDNMVPISRYSSINVTDGYTVILPPLMVNWIGLGHLWLPEFWVGLFTGIIGTDFIDFEILRHYVGPLVLPLSITALISFIQPKNQELLIAFRKKALFIALAGFLALMLCKMIPPVSLIFKLPIFSLIRNRHFFAQFFLFVIVILAGFGFDSLIKGNSKKIFSISCLLLALGSLILFFAKKELFTNFHNNTALLISIVSLVSIVISMKFLSRSTFIHFFLAVSAIIVFMSSFLFDRLPLSGQTTQNKHLLTARNFSDYSLKFHFERPDNIENIGILPTYENNITDFGKDEYASLLTLKDNSYKTVGGQFGLSSFPLLKSYMLFTSLPGHEQIIGKKFFFFNKCYTSIDPADMMTFKREPKLLEAMLSNGIGIADKLDDDRLSLGSFKQPSFTDAVIDKTPSNKFDVDILEYKANSLQMTVTVNSAGLFMYTDSWDKNWRAEVDGKEVPIRKMFHTFKGLELSSGTHEIKFSYLSNSLMSLLLMNFGFIFCFLSTAIFLFWEGYYR